MREVTHGLSFVSHIFMSLQKRGDLGKKRMSAIRIEEEGTEGFVYVRRNFFEDGYKFLCIECFFRNMILHLNFRE